MNANANASDSELFVDGQTRESFIAAIPRLHGDLRFSYRPMTYLEANKAEKAIAKQSTTEQQVACIVGAISRQVTEWSADGKPMVDRIRALKPRLIDRLYAIITGRDGGDPPTGATEQESDEYASELLAAGADEGSIGESREVSTVKN